MTSNRESLSDAQHRYEEGPVQIELRAIRELIQQQWRDHLAMHTFSDASLKERADSAQKAIDTALLSQEKAVNAALTAANTAVIKAEGAAEKRFESVNEFRATLADQQRSLMPRNEADVKFAAIENALQSYDKRITNVDIRVNDIQSTSEGSHSTWTMLGGIGLFMLALLTFLAAIIFHFSK